MAFIPAHSLVQASGATPKKTAFILHGILGHQRNWRSFAKSLSTAHPHWAFVLIDIRNHGRSQGSEGPHTVQTSAQDLVNLANHIGKPDAIIGHSYGGKVSLFFSALMSLEQCWILDSIPHPQSTQAQQDLRHIFEQLRNAGAPFKSREDMVEQLQAKGLTAGLIQWMTTNLKRSDAGYDWAFHLDNATDMIEDYFEWDAMPILEGTAHPIHLVRAADNSQWTEDIIDDIQSCAPLVQLHTLENAGHWVHVDNPTGLQHLMKPYFKA